MRLSNGTVNIAELLSREDELSEKGVASADKFLLAAAIRELYRECNRLTRRDEIRTGTTDPLILAMFDRLPPVGSEWTLKDRARWLATLDSILNLIYPADFGHSIEIRVHE